MFKPFLDYLKGIVNPTNGASEAKLFLALISFIYLFIASFIDLLTKWKPTTEIFFGMMGFIVTLLGIDTYKTIKVADIKGGIASDIVNTDAGKDSVQGAKDVLSSQKP